MFRSLSQPNIDYKESVRFLNPNPQSKITDDIHYPNVLFWLRMEGDNNGTTFSDSGPLSLTVTRGGTNPPVTSTNYVKNGASSGLFNASESFLSINDSRLILGTSNFTVEGWFYKLSNTALNDGLFSYGTNSTNYAHGISAVLYSAAGPSTIYVTASNGNTGDVFPANQWNHIALVREGTGTNQCKTYLNGVLIDTRTLSTNFSTNNFFFVGIQGTTSLCFDGYIDSFRLTKDIVRYTTNFNPETDTFL